MERITSFPGVVVRFMRQLAKKAAIGVAALISLAALGMVLDVLLLRDKSGRPE